MNVQFVIYRRVPPPTDSITNPADGDDRVAPDASGDWIDAGYDDGDPVVSRLERYSPSGLHAIESGSDDASLPGASWSLVEPGGEGAELHNAELIAVTQQQRSSG